jgi:hypothetical protein
MFGDKELYKEVEKKRLSELMPNHSFPPGQDYVVVDEDKNILNFCSGKYSLVRNEEIFKPIEDALKANDFKFIKRIVIINKAKFYVDYIIRERKDEGEIKGLFPRISIWNSYDGGSMMRHEMGFYRLVSQSGITRPLGESHKDIYRHATSLKDGNLTTEEKVFQIVEDTKKFIETCDKDVEVFKKMTEKKATKTQVASIAKKVGLSKKMAECAVARFEIETTESNLEYKNEHGEIVKHSGSKKNMFTLYNALNFAIYNMNTKELPEKKIDKDKKTMKYIVDLL